MVNKEKCFQTTNELMLNIVLKDYEEDLAFSKERLDTYAVDNDTETHELELPFYHKTLLKIEKIKGLIDAEKQSYYSVEHMICVFRKSDNDSIDYVTPSVADRF